MRRVVHPFKQARDHATGNRELVAKESLSADEQIEGVVCDRRGSFLKNVTFRPSGIAYGQASFLLLSGIPVEFLQVPPSLPSAVLSCFDLGRAELLSKSADGRPFTIKD